MLQLYWKKSPVEVEWFEDLMQQHPDLEFFQPNPEKAPWHVQCRVGNGVLINFWPHVRKAMINEELPVRYTAKDINALVWEARARVPDNFDVFEEIEDVPSHPTQPERGSPLSEETIPF